MANIIFEKLVIKCGPSNNVLIEQTVKYIIDSDGYKIYTPFIGCDQFPSTPCCKKCVDYVQRQMIENTIDTTIPLCIPANL